MGVSDVSVTSLPASSVVLRSDPPEPGTRHLFAVATDRPRSAARPVRRRVAHGCADGVRCWHRSCRPILTVGPDRQCRLVPPSHCLAACARGRCAPSRKPPTLFAGQTSQADRASGSPTCTISTSAITRLPSRRITLGAHFDKLILGHILMQVYVGGPLGEHGGLPHELLAIGRFVIIAEEHSGLVRPGADD